MNNRIRITALAVGLAGIMLGAPAVAQVTIQMTTAASQGCTAVTDSSGLSLVPNSTVLAATGVTLTGAGCGAGPADFQAAITVPGTTPVGTGVNVQWSAGAQATQCTYGGNSGLGGWPVGASACSGSACNGPHNVLVTPSVAQTYNLSITCTNASGYKAGSLLATPIQDPPTPNPFALVVTPSTIPVNSPVSVSWSVNGATSCTGSADLNGSSADLPGWTNTTDPVSPRSVTPTQAGTYSLSLTCSNAFGSATSTPGTGALVVSGGTTDNCPAGRLTTATIRYPNIGAGTTTRPNVDLTQFENIWGHATNADTAVLWPGRDGAVDAVVNWGKTQYIASKFTVPVGVSPSLSDVLGYSGYFSGPLLTMSVSQNCGDFTPPLPNLCLTTGVAGGNPFKKMSIAPATNGCPLVPGQTYFVNLKMTAPTAADCGNSTLCTLSVNNGHN